MECDAADPGLQHTVPLFENERLRISDFRLPAAAVTTVSHTWPTVRWQVGQGSHMLNGDCAPVLDKQVHFVESNSKWFLENVGEDIYRQVVFELLQPPMRSEDEVKSILTAAKYSTDVGTELLFENSLCRCWDFYLKPGGGDPAEVHQHTMDYAFILVAPSRLLGYHPSGELAFDDAGPDGKVVWASIPTGGFHSDGTLLPEARHAGKNGYDDRPFREYLIELK